MPPAVVTSTSTVAADSAGEMAEQLVVDEQLTPVPELDPKATVLAPMTNPVPVMVTVVVPVSGPALGLTAVTVGTAT